MSPQRLVILREVGSDRYLPIWVGQYEAEMITVGLQEVEVSRPLTHDLMKNVFTTFNARIKRIEIISLKEDSSTETSWPKWTAGKSALISRPRTPSHWPSAPIRPSWWMKP